MKLHELLAIEKTATAAWNTLVADTRKKLKAPDNFFRGHSRNRVRIHGRSRRRL